MTSRFKAPGPFRWLCVFLVAAVTLGVAPAAMGATTVPAQVAKPSAAPGDGQVTLTWTAPDTGGSPITDYRVQYAEHGTVNWMTYPDGTPNPPLLTATVTLLTNGKAYDFRVRAGNAIGWGLWSEAVTATPTATPIATVPAQMTAPTTTALLEAVKVDWVAPDDGGSDITDYRVQYRKVGDLTWVTFPDGVSTALTATVTFLDPLSYYQFRVRAGNAIGWGTWSLASAQVKPLANPTPGVPAQVVMTSATPDVDHVHLLWAIPADGGSTITDYRVQYRKVGDLAWATFPDGVSIANTATVTLLTANTAYDFRVRAGNSIGWGAWSLAIGATTLLNPTPTVPAQMAAPTTTAQVEAVKLDWVAPGTGGSPITDYRVQYRKVGDLAWVTFPDGVSTALTATVTFLDSDFSYEFRVRAGNVNGWGAWSPASIAVKPLAASSLLPGAPGTLVADTLLIYESVHLVWGAASAPGAYPVTDYRVEYREVGALSWVTYPDGVSTSTTATVTLLLAGHQYEFRVKARNINGWGPYSNIATATPVAP